MTKDRIKFPLRGLGGFLYDSKLKFSRTIKNRIIFRLSGFCHYRCTRIFYFKFKICLIASGGMYVRLAVASTFRPSSSKILFKKTGIASPTSIKCP